MSSENNREKNRGDNMRQGEKRFMKRQEEEKNGRRDKMS